MGICWRTSFGAWVPILVTVLAGPADAAPVTVRLGGNIDYTLLDEVEPWAPISVRLTFDDETPDEEPLENLSSYSSVVPLAAAIAFGTLEFHPPSFDIQIENDFHGQDAVFFEAMIPIPGTATLDIFRIQLVDLSASALSGASLESLGSLSPTPDRFRFFYQQGSPQLPFLLARADLNLVPEAATTTLLLAIVASVRVASRSRLHEVPRSRATGAWEGSG